MDMNGINNSAGKDGGLSCATQFVRILLVDHDTNSLMSLASQFEQKFYKVTTTKSATIALSLFQVQKSEYDIVIADTRMPEMDISEFVHKLIGQGVTIPIVLIAEDLEMNLTKEALASGVCYVFSKPLSHRDIANVWQHIPRVTGKMPVLIDMGNNITFEKDVDPNSDINIGGTSEKSNLELKIMDIDRENKKRKNNQIPGNSNFPSDTKEGDGCNSNKKSRLSWTSDLHEKFLHAINIIGKNGVRPKTILRLMNEPKLTIRHIASHLQKFRGQTRRSSNLQKPTSPVVPDVLPAASPSIFAQGQATSTPQIPRSPNQKPAGANGHVSDSYVLPASTPSIFAQGQTIGKVDSNYTETCGTPQIPRLPNQEPTGANGHVSDGWEAPNQEPIDHDFEALLYGFGTVDGLSNMNKDNFGEGTGASNQYFDGMASSDEINILQEFEDSEFNIWDLIN